MAVVPLRFQPPTELNIVALHIYESPTSDGQFTEIERATAVGTPPNYISSYETNLAVSDTDWFAIAWEDSSGAVTPISAPIKGGTSTLIGDIVDRVMMRMPSAKEAIVIQEAEATVSFVYRVDDPYTIDPTTVSRLWLTELVNLTLVAVQYVQVALISSTFGQQYAAGMVSESSNSGTNATTVLQSIEALEKRALRRLGIGGSLVASIQDQIVDGVLISGFKTTFDSSRVLSTRAIITERILSQDLDSGLIISDR